MMEMQDTINNLQRELASVMEEAAILARKEVNTHPSRCIPVMMCSATNKIVPECCFYTLVY